VFVGPAGVGTGPALSRWLRWCTEFVETLPPKNARGARR
jgi:hypothetical protein